MIFDIQLWSCLILANVTFMLDKTFLGFIWLSAAVLIFIIQVEIGNKEVTA